MIKLFTQHPKSLGETYFEHLKFASYFGFTLTVGGIACIIHAVFPFLFQKTGTNALFKMIHFYLNRLPHMEERMQHVSQAIMKKSQVVDISSNI